MQGIINKDARAITRIQKNIPIKILLIEANLRIAKIILDARQRKFSVKLTVFTDENPAKNILPVIFKKKDRSAQPIKQLINNTNQIKKEKKKRNQLGMRLIKNINIITVNPAEDIETIRQIISKSFPSIVIISSKK